MLIHCMCILGVTYLVIDLPRKIVGFPSQILWDPGVGILRGILFWNQDPVLCDSQVGFCGVFLEPRSWSWDLVRFWNQDPGVGIL